MLVFPILLVFCSTAAAESQDPREGREMSVFTVVRFPNEVCTSASGLNGTCYTASECTSRSGSASGSCASSFGVCCVFTLSCGATTSQNNTYATISHQHLLHHQQHGPLHLHLLQVQHRCLQIEESHACRLSLI